MDRPLTDVSALNRQRRRARRSGRDMFLHDIALAEVNERLGEVNRTFNDVSIVSPFPEKWAAAFPRARIIPDDSVLDLTESTNDLVIHALSLHWTNDPLGHLIQCRRALRPDGLFLGVLLGGQTLHELRSCLAEAEIAVSGGLSARVAPMAEVRELGGLMQRSHLAMPVADSLALQTTYQRPRNLMHELRGMGEGNALDARSRKPMRRDVLDLAETLYTRTFPAEAGRIAATFELIFLTGWAASDQQPRALRPGSASHRLADALNVTEHGAEERALPKAGQSD